MSFVLPHFERTIQRETVESQGLVGCYPLACTPRGTVPDVSGYGRDGTLSGGLSADALRHASSEFGTALQFVRANTVQVVLGSTSYGNTTTGSISLMFKLGTVANAQFHTFFGYGGASTTNPGTLRLDVTRSSGTMSFRFVQRSDGDAAFNTVTFALEAEDDAWHHLAVTSDGSTWRMYIDGIERTLTVAAGSNSGNWFGDTTIGSGVIASLGKVVYNGSNTNFLDASLADVRLYDVCLDHASIALISAGLG